LNLNPSLKLPFLLELVEPETDPDSDDLGAFKISLFFAPGFAAFGDGSPCQVGAQRVLSGSLTFTHPRHQWAHCHTGYQEISFAIFVSMYTILVCVLQPIASGASG
jgi:hypothetical protein